MPNGNVLSTWWPGVLVPSVGLTFDQQLIEVTEAKETAWALSVFNTGESEGYGVCKDDGDIQCFRSVSVGWKVYSAERFYDRPKIFALALDKGVLSFTAVAPIKRNNPSNGTWVLLDHKRVAARGDCLFKAHWRPNHFSFPVPVATKADTLKVLDEWGNAAIQTFRRAEE